VEEELCEFQVAGLGDLQIEGGTGDDGNFVSGAFDDGGLIGADEAVGGRFSEGALEQPEAESLRRLGEHDGFARDGAGDECSVGGALDLLDGIDGGHADDGGSVLNDGINGAVDSGGVDEGADRVVDKDDVIGIGMDGGERVSNGFLAVIAALDDLDAMGEVVVGVVLGDLRLNAVHLGFADGDVDLGDAGDGREGAQRMDEDRDAAEGEELFGLRPGHARTQAGCGENGEHLHNSPSIQREGSGESGAEGRWDRGTGTKGQRDRDKGTNRASRGLEKKYPAGVPALSDRELRLDLSLLRPGMRLAVGVSGGADSVALLRALAARAGELGLVLHVAHLHHGLRGAEADADLEFVRELARKLGLPFLSKQVDTEGEAARCSETIEEAARRLRYGWFRELMGGGTVDVQQERPKMETIPKGLKPGDSFGARSGTAEAVPLQSRDSSGLGTADAVATAHTLDDQAETVLAKVLRGAWTEGISGIHPVVEFAEGRVVRPLLATRRAEVEMYLKALGQEWREDSSNRHLTFTRNRIRHELLPVLEAWNPRLREHLAQMAELARDEESWWETEVARVAPEMILVGRPVRGGGRAAAEGVALDVSKLSELPVGLQRRVVRHAAERMGSAVDFAGTEKLRELALHGRAGQKCELAGGLRAERSHRELRFSMQPAEKASAPEQIEVPVPGEAEGFGLRVRIEVLPSGAKAPGLLGQSNGTTEVVPLQSIGNQAEARTVGDVDEASDVADSDSFREERQGLKPAAEFGGLVGTTEVVPCYKAERSGRFGVENEVVSIKNAPVPIQGEVSVQSEPTTGKALLRTWRAGDRVRLRHSGGPRKVKEVLERMKVSGAERTCWPVVELNGRIVWMQGVQVEPEAGVRVMVEPVKAVGSE
jgi:tRNA(Ile)-lysidine synthase